jgi:hypothetical protein
MRIRGQQPEKMTSSWVGAGGAKSSLNEQVGSGIRGEVAQGFCPVE